jgi:hypothetical protein
MTTRPGYVWDATASEWVEIGQAAVLAPIKYQTSQPSSPATGDIWIDSDDEVPSVDSTLYYRWTKTMSGGETSLSGTDNNSLALKYTPGYESVFINGVLQVRGSDYVATTGTTVTGLTALTANDVVMVESIVAYSVGDTYTQSQMTSLLDAKSPVSTTGLVLLASQTIGSAVSSVVVSNVFSSAYDNYKIVITGGANSTDSQVLSLTFGSTTTGYYYAQAAANYASASFTAYNGTNTSSFFRAGDASTNQLTMNLDVLSPFIAKFTVVNGSIVESGTNGSAGAFNGHLRNTTSYTSFTVTPSGGTMTGGTIKVYGYK